MYCIQLWFCLVAFLGHVYCIHFGFVFFGSLYIQVIQGFIHDDHVFFGSLYIQVIQGFIHDDHEDLINKHVMMIRVTDNI